LDSALQGGKGQGEVEKRLRAGGGHLSDEAALLVTGDGVRTNGGADAGLLFASWSYSLKETRIKRGERGERREERGEREREERGERERGIT